MRIFVTGHRGLVGSALVPILQERGHDVAGGDLPEFDAGRLRDYDRCAGREWIVNLAAFTDVDGAERRPEVAESVNGITPGAAAAACLRLGARLLHVSTDYVFDGTKDLYAEEDAPRPLSAYGRSKLRGEESVRETLAPAQWLIVRGQSLYGRARKSFPDAILKAAAEKPEIPVVVDQVVQPTWARDFAEGLAILMEKRSRGVFHLAASGSCSWNEFARAVLEEAGVAGARVTETTAAALARPAPRPSRSVFDLSKFEKAAGVRPRPWREQLRDYLRATGRAA